MSFYSRGLVASFEELEETQSATVMPEESVEEQGETSPEAAQQEPVIHAEELESQLLDSTVATNEVEQLEEQVEDAEEVAAALESLIELGNEALREHGGFDRMAGTMFNQQLHQLANRVGVDMNRMFVPSNESFGGSDTRYNSTTYSLEAAHGILSKTFQAIGNSVSVMGNKVSNAFNAIFSNADALIKRAEKMKERLPELQGKQPMSASFLAFRVGSTVKKGGKLLTGPQAASEWANTLEMLHKNYKGKELADTLSSFFDALGTEEEQKVAAVLPKVLDMARPKWGKILTDAEITKIMFKQILSSMISESSKQFLEEKFSKGRDMELFGVHVPGNYVIYQTVLSDDIIKNKGVRGDFKLSSIYYKAGCAKLPYKDKDKEKVKTMTAQEIEQTLNEVIRIANLVKQIRSDVQAVHAKSSTLAANMNRLAKEQGKAKSKDDNVEIKGVLAATGDWFSGRYWKHALRNLTDLIYSPHYQTARYAVAQSASLLKYCEISIKAHKEEVVDEGSSEEQA